VIGEEAEATRPPPVIVARGSEPRALTLKQRGAAGRAGDIGRIGGFLRGWGRALIKTAAVEELWSPRHYGWTWKDWGATIKSRSLEGRSPGLRTVEVFINLQEWKNPLGPGTKLGNP